MSPYQYPPFIRKFGAAMGLLVSGVAVLSLLAFFPSQSRILTAKIGVICAAISSLGLFIFCLRGPSISDITITAASLVEKIEIMLGLPVSGYVMFSLPHFSPNQPHVFSSEIGVICGLLSSVVVFNFCWAASFAYLTRKRNWSPNACYWVGMPFALLGGALLLVNFYSSDGPKPFLPLAIISLSGSTTALCRKLAFPSMSPEDFYTVPRPPSIFSR
jgi:hypothetical protein